MHKKYWKSVADNNVPATLLLSTLSQEPVLLVRRIRRLLVPLRLQTKPLILVLYLASRSLFMSRLSSPNFHMWSWLDNSPPPAMSQTNSALLRWVISYFSCSEITGFRIPNPDFLTRIALRAPTMGERFFLFPRKGKKFSRIILSTPANAYHVYQVKHCRNIHSDWIARTTAV